MTLNQATKLLTRNGCHRSGGLKRLYESLVLLPLVPGLPPFVLGPDVPACFVFALHWQSGFAALLSGG